MTNSEHLERCLALEKTYVAEFYEQICTQVTTTYILPSVTTFLDDLEFGSVICDVGCGTGNYLSTSSTRIYSIGGERCKKLGQITRLNQKEIIFLDNLLLPYRDECLDAVLSIAVIHHFSTKKRRISAIRELSRVLRIGGRILITVCSMEHNAWEIVGQDNLIPISINNCTNSNLQISKNYCCTFIKKLLQNLSSSSSSSSRINFINSRCNTNVILSQPDNRQQPIHLRGFDSEDEIEQFSDHFYDNSTNNIIKSRPTFIDNISTGIGIQKWKLLLTKGGNAHSNDNIFVTNLRRNLLKLLKKLKSYYKKGPNPFIKTNIEHTTESYKSDISLDSEDSYASVIFLTNSTVMSPKRTSPKNPPDNLEDADEKLLTTNNFSPRDSNAPIMSGYDAKYGNEIITHSYYHLFSKGELEALIECYVQNLHIISSYCDHTNWCVIAEKVQVWSI